MNRFSGRDIRMAALEAQARETVERLDVMADQQAALMADMAHVKRMQDRVIQAVLKLSRELGAQRERYPLD